ncbi:MAG: hypothetical protein QME92_08805 [Bacillota bacterium]|nr:hypothetical protein [Bacillota bacterium]
MTDQTGQAEGLKWFRSNLHVWAFILGAFAVVIAQFADKPRSAGLYSIIALGPVLGGLVTLVRYRRSDGTPRSIGKIVVECGWVCFSFGLGYLMMLPSRYYAVQGGVAALLILDAVALVAVGGYTLYKLGRLGLSLTP